MKVRFVSDNDLGIIVCHPYGEQSEPGVLIKFVIHFIFRLEEIQHVLRPSSRIIIPDYPFHRNKQPWLLFVYVLLRETNGSPVQPTWPKKSLTTACKCCNTAAFQYTESCNQCTTYLSVCIKLVLNCAHYYNSIRVYWVTKRKILLILLCNSPNDRKPLIYYQCQG